MHTDAFQCDCTEYPHTDDCLESTHCRIEALPDQCTVHEILDLDYQLQNHYHVVADDIPARVYSGHKIFVQERREHEKEVNAPADKPYFRQFG